jgi:hypothetical protein
VTTLAQPPVARTHVDDHVEVVVGPFRLAVQLGDAPGVDLVRPGGDEFGLDRGGVGGLRAALAAFAGLAQHPVVGGDRSEVGALVQQGRPYLVRGQVSEPAAVKRVQDCLPLSGASARGWACSLCGTGVGLGAGGLIRCRRYQMACATLATGRAALVPI